MNEFGFKELYEVIIRTTYPIEVSGKTLEAGEAIAVFDKVQVGNFQEIKSSVTARGGWDNRGLVFWDATREVRINLTQGIFSKSQFALMTAAKLITSSNDQVLTLTKIEKKESDENGNIELSNPAKSPIFVYKVSTGERLTYSVVDETHLHIEESYTDCMIDYSYEYTNQYQTLVVGQALTSGFLTLEGKTRVKDDITGQTHTGIIYIPRLKLVSDLSMRLGENAQPIVGRLDATAIPTGDRKNTEVMKVIFLDDDIDSDM